MASLTHTQILGYNADSHSYRPEKERKKTHTQNTQSERITHLKRGRPPHAIGAEMTILD